jgi:hypothetical protein
MTVNYPHTTFVSNNYLPTGRIKKQRANFATTTTSRLFCHRDSTIELKTSLGAGNLNGGSEAAVKTELTALDTKLTGMKSSGTIAQYRKYLQEIELMYNTVLK